MSSPNQESGTYFLPDEQWEVPEPMPIEKAYEGWDVAYAQIGATAVVMDRKNLDEAEEAWRERYDSLHPDIWVRSELAAWMEPDKVAKRLAGSQAFLEARRKNSQPPTETRRPVRQFIKRAIGHLGIVFQDRNDQTDSHPNLTPAA